MGARDAERGAGPAPRYLFPMRLGESDRQPARRPARGVDVPQIVIGDEDDGVVVQPRKAQSRTLLTACDDLPNDYVIRIHCPSDGARPAVRINSR
jgi:hypothetical protein